MNTTAFSEELYKVQPPLTLVLDTPWSDLTAEAREMINNLCTAVKTRPGPTVIYRAAKEFLADEQLPPTLVIFGESLPELPIHKITNWRGSKVLVSYTANGLSGNAAAKKELWTTLQELILQTSQKPA